MRRGWLIVLAVFFLILPVSAQADGAETQLGALVLKKGAESAQTTIRNDTAYPGGAGRGGKRAADGPAKRTQRPGLCGRRRRAGDGGDQALHAGQSAERRGGSGVRRRRFAFPAADRAEGGGRRPAGLRPPALVAWRLAAARHPVLLSGRRAAKQAGAKASARMSGATECRGLLQKNSYRIKTQRTGMATTMPVRVFSL